MKHKLLALTVHVVILSPWVASGVETVGCPHDVGRGNVKARFNFNYSEAEKTYSDEVRNALLSDSPYGSGHDKMVDLPHGWHQRQANVALGLEYGIVDRLSAGVLLPYVSKDVRRQVWSKKEGRPAWKEIEEDGLEDIWFALKYQIYSKPPVWEDGGIFLAVGYKPSISSDTNITSGIGTGADHFTVAALAHPYFTENLFLCSDIWHEYRGEVKGIQGFAKSGWDLGDRFGYRAFLGYEFAGHKLVVIGGPVGWIAGRHEDGDTRRLEDSDTYSHNLVVKFRWQPLGDEDLGSVDVGVRIPYADKTTFAPDFVFLLGARIKF